MIKSAIITLDHCVTMCTENEVKFYVRVVKNKKKACDNCQDFSVHPVDSCKYTVFHLSDIQGL